MPDLRISLSEEEDRQLWGHVGERRVEQFGTRVLEVQSGTGETLFKQTQVIYRGAKARLFRVGENGWSGYEASLLFDIDDMFRSLGFDLSHEEPSSSLIFHNTKPARPAQASILAQTMLEAHAGPPAAIARNEFTHHVVVSWSRRVTEAGALKASDAEMLCTLSDDPAIGAIDGMSKLSALADPNLCPAN